MGGCFAVTCVSFLNRHSTVDTAQSQSRNMRPILSLCALLAAVAVAQASCGTTGGTGCEPCSNDASHCCNNCGATPCCHGAVDGTCWSCARAAVDSKLASAAHAMRGKQGCASHHARAALSPIDLRTAFASVPDPLYQTRRGRPNTGAALHRSRRV